MDLRVEGGGMPTPEKKLPFVGLRGWPGQRWTSGGRAWTGRGGEVRESTPVADEVGGGSASGGEEAQSTKPYSGAQSPRETHKIMITDMVLLLFVSRQYPLYFHPYA
jgi:hypothetical protein